MEVVGLRASEPEIVNYSNILGCSIIRFKWREDSYTLTIEPDISVEAGTGCNKIVLNSDLCMSVHLFGCDVPVDDQMDFVLRAIGLTNVEMTAVIECYLHRFVDVLVLEEIQEQSEEQEVLTTNRYVYWS